MNKKRVLIIYNPMAGRQGLDRLMAVIDCLTSAGAEVVQAATQYAGHGGELAKAQDFDVLVAAGGDGTVNEVLNGLTEISPPFAFVPLGTANVLAHEIGLGRSPEEIAKTILQGVPLAISCGTIDGRRFLLMVSVGPDALAVSALNSSLKKKLVDWRMLWREFPLQVN